MMHGFKEIRIPMGLFDFSVICIIGDRKKITKYIQWKFDDPHFEGNSRGYECRGQVLFKTGYVPVLWIPRKPKTAREYATLAHEALHCVYHLFYWVGMKMNTDTEELATHSMAHIINAILESK